MCSPLYARSNAAISLGIGYITISLVTAMGSSIEENRIARRARGIYYVRKAGVGRMSAGVGAAMRLLWLDKLHTANPKEKRSMKPILIARRLAALTTAAALLISSVALAADIHVMISAGFFQAYSALGP